MTIARGRIGAECGGGRSEGQLQQKSAECDSLQQQLDKMESELDICKATSAQSKAKVNRSVEQC